MEGVKLVYLMDRGNDLLYESKDGPFRCLLTGPLDKTHGLQIGKKEGFEGPRRDDYNSCVGVRNGRCEGQATS